MKHVQINWFGEFHEVYKISQTYLFVHVSHKVCMYVCIMLAVYYSSRNPGCILTVLNKEKVRTKQQSFTLPSSEDLILLHNYLSFSLIIGRFILYGINVYIQEQK